MTKSVRAVVAAVSMFVLCAGSTAVFAASAKSPAETLAELTGKSVENVIAEKIESGQTYGAMAQEAGKLAEFTAANLEAKKDILAEQVASGKISQERADVIMGNIDKNMAACDGTAAGGAGAGAGIGAGAGAGNGNGNGQGNRDGSGTGGGNRDGSGSGGGNGGNGGGNGGGGNGGGRR